MNEYLQKLIEWKEKVLFGIVLLITVMIAAKARPVPGTVADIDAEIRASAIAGSGATTEQAEKALNLLRSPTEITPATPNEAAVNRPFFDERDGFVSGRSSAWSLTEERYESMPAIELEVPGMGQLPDFDLPAGSRPSTARLTGFVPHDGRTVNLRGSGEDENR